jgi:hypothetical protein
MNITFWVALLFGITLSLYFLGGQSHFQTALSKYSGDPTMASMGSNDANAIFRGFIDSILSWNTALVVGSLAMAAVMGFNLLALIPLGAIMLVLNYMIFPLDFISKAGFPSEISIPITLFFTLTEVMIVFSLIRGSFR